jgi:hypothetical protein
LQWGAASADESEAKRVASLAEFLMFAPGIDKVKVRCLCMQLCVCVFVRA